LRLNEEIVQIIAKVFDLEISDKDVSREVCCGGNSTQALRRLIDRCLLLSKAIQVGFSVSEEEFDLALMELLDEEEPFGLPAGYIQEMDAAEMETLLKRNILIKKYLNSIYPADIDLTDKNLQEIYQDQQENFCCDEMVRCSHILIKGDNARQRALIVRSEIHSPEDFAKVCKNYSDCPSNECCGDLGFFPRGKLFPEIEKVAFGLAINQISDPFPSPEGYHILMLTDRKKAGPIPFEEIKASLANQIRQMEREYFLMKHLSELYEECQSNIKLFHDAQ
jgi:parvulin-like peptidyl-prolyl isomerase